nr:DUF1127 domain-containing protein [Spartinivicinus marinus]
MVRWKMNSQQRRQLAKLPHYLLKDIGVTELEQQREVSKPFWQH